MIKEHSATALRNLKVNKTFTPRTSEGNLERILKLRKPILEKWASLNNRFYYLPTKERELFAKKMAPKHALKSWLGKNWRDSLGMREASDLNIVMAELQLGEKYGEDIFKTSVNANSLMTRARAYTNALKEFNSNPRIPYGNGLVTAFAESDDIEVVTAPALTSERSANIVDKAFRAMARFFRDGEGEVSDEE